MRKLPDSWGDASVADLCTLLNGLAFKPEDWTIHGLPILRIQNLNGSKEFNRYDKPVPPAYVIEGGTLLFSWSGNRGTSFGPYRWNGPKAILNQHIFKVTPKPDVDPAWLLHALSIARQLAERAAHGGSGLVHVRRGDLLGYRVPSPLLPEQRQIAEILDTVDEAIRKTEEIIAKLKQVKQGLLHDLLTRGIDENGELRDPQRHPEQFKDSPLGRIPKEWQLMDLESATVAPICYGIVQAGPFVPDGPLVLMIRDLQGNFRSGIHRTSSSIDRQYERSRVQRDDLLVSIKGTIGRVAVVPQWYKGNISRDLARLRFGSLVDPHFARYYFCSPRGSRRLELAVVGTTRAEISIHVLKRLRIPVPPLSEQSGLATRLDAMSSSLAITERELCKLRLLKQGLMEDLLTGRVRVTRLLKNAAE